MDFDQFLSSRAKRVHGSLGKQTSVVIEGLINLGSGTPDFQPPQAILEAMGAAISAGKVQYTQWSGIPELRAAIAGKLLNENHIEADPDSEIIVTSGGQEGLMLALMTLLDDGDEALTPSPHYDEYTRDAMILGGKLVAVPTTLESNFTITAAQLEAMITPRTKALVIVTPNNPTGTVIPESTLREVAELAIRRNLIVIADEIYEYYVFNGNKHFSIASLPGMKERTITINSFSKGYGLTGMRLGYVCAPAPIIQAMLPLHHAMMICAPVVTQYGGVAALKNDRSWFAPILAEYDRRAHVWMQTLDQIGLSYSQPQGAYYIFIDIRSTGLSSADFVKKVRDEAKLIFQPGTIGGGAGEGFIRGALTTPSPKFEEGLARFTSFISQLKR